MNLNIIIDNINKTCINDPMFVDKSYLKSKIISLYINENVYKNNPDKIISIINKSFLSKPDYENLILDSEFMNEKIVENLELKNIKRIEFEKGKELTNEIFKHLKNIPKIYVEKVTDDLKEKQNIYHNGIIDFKNNLFYSNPTYRTIKDRNYVIISNPVDEINIKDLELIFRINPNIIEVDFAFDDPEKYMDSIDKILNLTSNISKIKLKSNISKDNLNLFKTIKEKYKDKNILFEISYTKELNVKHSKENDALCTLDEYINMEEILNVYVNSIKKHNYSPFEQVLCAYDITKSYEYIMENMDEDPQISRQLHTSILGEKIVCVGYASIFNSILSKLNISCANYGIFVYEKDKFEGHERSVIYLKDEKYNIDGIFICDPTWDRRRDNDINPLDRYTYFMINPNDVPNFELIENLNGISIIHYFKNNLKYDYNALIDFIEIHNKLFNINYSDGSDIDKYIDNFIDKSNDRITYSKLLKAIIKVRSNEGIYNSHDEVKERIKSLIEINREREAKEYKQNSEIISRKNKKILKLDDNEKIYRFTKKHFII